MQETKEIYSNNENSRHNKALWFSQGWPINGWIASAEEGVNGCVWLKLIERYFYFSSIINTNLHFTFVGNASSPAYGKVSRVLRIQTKYHGQMLWGQGIFGLKTGRLLWKCTCQMLRDVMCISPTSTRSIQPLWFCVMWV